MKRGETYDYCITGTRLADFAKRGETYDYCITGTRLADFAVIKSNKRKE